MKTTDCSFPDVLLQFETIRTWATLFNSDCKRHDSMLKSEARVPGYGILNTLKGENKKKARRLIDDLFRNDMLKTADENEERYGYLAHAAAEDMFRVVTAYRDNLLFRIAIGLIPFDNSK